MTNYTCFECEKTFPSAEALQQHLKSMHVGVPKKALPALYVWLALGAIVLIIVAFYAYPSFAPSKYDAFAQCISDSGAKFYGAFWCPHCSEQKALFGTSAKYLPYVECSTADKKDRLPVCITAGIESYPTWVFSDGTRDNVMTLKQLSQKTSCELPA